MKTGHIPRRQFLAYSASLLSVRSIPQLNLSAGSDIASAESVLLRKESLWNSWCVISALESAFSDLRSMKTLEQTSDKFTGLISNSSKIKNVEVLLSAYDNLEFLSKEGLDIAATLKECFQFINEPETLEEMKLQLAVSEEKFFTIINNVRNLPTAFPSILEAEHIGDTLPILQNAIIKLTSTLTLENGCLDEIMTRKLPGTIESMFENGMYEEFPEMFPPKLLQSLRLLMVDITSNGRQTIPLEFYGEAQSDPMQMSLNHLWYRLGYAAPQENWIFDVPRLGRTNDLDKSSDLRVHKAWLEEEKLPFERRNQIYHIYEPQRATL